VDKKTSFYSQNSTSITIMN